MNKDMQELMEYFRAKYPLVWIETADEARTSRSINAVAQSSGAGTGAGVESLHWSSVGGFVNASGVGVATDMLDPTAALTYVLEYGGSAIFVLHDFHWYVDAGNPMNADNIRFVRMLGDALKNGLGGGGGGGGGGAKRKMVVFTSAPGALKMPPDLQAEVTMMRWSLPSREELGAALDVIIEAYGAEGRSAMEKQKAEVLQLGRDSLVTASQGLTLVEAENCWARALTRGVTTSEDAVAVVAEGKRQAVSRSGVVEWVEPPSGGMSWVGGLDVFKEWLRIRKRAFTADARAAGLPLPKGTLAIGPAGTGKSLITMAAAAYWGFPVVRLGQVMGSLLGESEANMRRALEVAEAAAPCVLHIDEIEKVFSGVSGSGDTDGGVKAGLFGMFLTWMQEKKSAVFVAATANRVEQLPSELLRKGRLTAAA